MTAPLDLEGIKERLAARQRSEFNSYHLTATTAPADLAALVAEVERLTALQGETGLITFMHQRDEARAEVERLTKERDEARTVATQWFGASASGSRWCDRTIDLWYSHRKTIESWPVQEGEQR